MAIFTDVLRSILARLPKGWRLPLAIVAMVAFGFGGGVAMVRPAPLPPAVAPVDSLRWLASRVDTIEAQQRAGRASLDRVTRGVQFLVCRDERRRRGADLEKCDRFWDDEDFLPPERGDHG